MSRFFQRFIPLACFLFLICFLGLIRLKESFALRENKRPLVEPTGTENKDTGSEAEEISKEQEKHHEQFQLEPCTVINPNTHNFIDLRSLSADGNEGKPQTWLSKGYDIGYNFSVGICSSPFRKIPSMDEMVDVSNLNSIGAYYLNSTLGKYYSIGEYSTFPVIRGRKLTLTYQNGSFCDAINSITGERLRKSTILSFTCDREMKQKATVSFIGSSNDCSYFFEVRSNYACPTAAKEDNLIVVWIFLFIVLCAIVVYFSGEFLYRHIKKPKSTF